tara:strand:- start:1378 stop:1611 length:234 start_codon:yes stop_codon:yes gene_type:complete
LSASTAIRFAEVVHSHGVTTALTSVKKAEAQAEAQASAAITRERANPEIKNRRVDRQTNPCSVDIKGQLICGIGRPQ